MKKNEFCFTDVEPLKSKNERGMLTCDGIFLRALTR